ncbi:hypothetical protein ROA7450_03836 [Roseovarius albus]|uniref:Uncharacterized protein n=1 Tax=Roseovarius albus TaxID=1247867 RepID=A0A1X7A4G2_9RHOB|nr:hypothetical protein [Roseovarius albus]SLN70292.1 hypothetical protein ROA7450_03836 [Roseovarius albus]
MKFRHKVHAARQDGGVFVDIRENYYDREMADWAVLSPEDAMMLKHQLDSALNELGYHDSSPINSKEL